MHFNKNKFRKLNNIVLVSLLTFALGLSFLTGCGDETPEPPVVEEPEQPDVSSLENLNEEELEEISIDTENTPLYEMVEEDLADEYLIAGETPFEMDKATTYGRKVHCLFDMPTQGLIFQCCFNSIPASDDTELYLFHFDSWEDANDLSRDPIASTRKGHTMQFCLDYNRTCLFDRYVPALKVNGEYIPISPAKYMTNPGTLAMNQSEAPTFSSKKGLLIDPATLHSEKLTSLNIQRGIYNIPLSLVIGESTNENIATTEFEYEGQVYYFNTANLYTFDAIFSALNEDGIAVTAIILNDWNENHPEIIHPLSRTQTGKSLYYAFNTEEEDGAKLMEATALFLAERYSTGWYGMVTEWVIANEINQHTSWNYMKTNDVAYYTECFERSFRIFYNAIKSQYANAKVYFSIDHDWNDNNGNNSKWFNGKDILTTFNTIALKGGNYDWGVAIHPYPNPLTRVNYWAGKYDMTENAPILTIMNLSALTSVLEKPAFRNTQSDVRSVAITELGFTSNSGERLQAAAFAYCYYIVEANPYIDSFMMNRQTDAYEEMKTGLYFGIYNADLTEKYLYDVFRDIDSPNPKEDYSQFMLTLLKADSLEEALSWAVPHEDEEEADAEEADQADSNASDTDTASNADNKVSTKVLKAISASDSAETDSTANDSNPETSEDSGSEVVSDTDASDHETTDSAATTTDSDSASDATT